MISTVVCANLDTVMQLRERTQLFALAESLGGIETLIEHLAIMIHASARFQCGKKLA